MHKYFFHINISILLWKVEQIKLFFESPMQLVRGIIETKFVTVIFDSQFFMKEYSLIRYDDDKKNGDVA